MTQSREVRDVRDFMETHFQAWIRSEPEEIAAWYTDDVEVWLNGGAQKFAGKEAARKGFIEPYCAQLPGQVHDIRRITHEGDRVAIEIEYRATDKQSGRKVTLPSGNFYVLREDKIAQAHLYINPEIFNAQISGQGEPVYGVPVV